MVNDIGFQAIINKVSCLLNPQIVQGNWKEQDMYNKNIAELREDIATELMANLDTWGISENNYEYIVNTIMTTVKWFATRMFDNKERESYGTAKIGQIETIHHF